MQEVQTVTLPSVAAVCVVAGGDTPRQNGNDSVDIAEGHIPTSVSISGESERKKLENQCV